MCSRLGALAFDLLPLTSRILDLPHCVLRPLTDKRDVCRNYNTDVYSSCCTFQVFSSHTFKGLAPMLPHRKTTHLKCISPAIHLKCVVSTQVYRTSYSLQFMVSTLFFLSACKFLTECQLEGGRKR